MKPSAPTSSEPSGDIWLYLRILWQRMWLVLFCVGVGAAAGVLSLQKARPVYVATAVLKYEPRSNAIVDLGERSSTLYQRDEIATAVQLVKSPVVAENVLRAIGQEPGVPSPAAEVAAPAAPPAPSLSDRWNGMLRSLRSRLVNFKPQELDRATSAREDAIRGILSGVQVVQRPSTKLIEVRYAGGNALKAAQIANQFCEQFIRSLDDDRRQRMLYARDFLDQQIRDAKVRLAEHERAAFDYSVETDTRALDKDIEIMTSTMASTNQQVESLRTEIKLLEAQDRAAREPNARRVLLETDSYYTQLRQRLTDLQIKKGTAEAENSPDHPDVRRAERELIGLGKQIEEIELQAAAQVSGRLAIEKEKLTSLEERLEQQRQEVAVLQEKMITYRVLTREVDSAQAIFANLLDQYKRVEVLGESESSNASIVSRATPPRLPASPSVSKVLGSHLFFGLAAGIALVLLLHFTDRSVKNPAVVEEKLGLATLALVPSLGKKAFGRGARRQTLLDPATHDIQTEAFNYLRTSIQYSSASQSPRTLLVTSCMPQEGKSTIAANLAGFFVGQGGKAILIDADLKRPTVHRAFDIPRMPGLSDVLAGQVPLEQAIVASHIPGVDVLPAGMASPSPINLLDSAAMTALLAKLRNDYTAVILDSAPCHGMADSLVLAGRVDGVVLVVRTGRTAMELLSRTVEKLRGLNARVLGAVYNSPRSRTGDDYGYGYSYNYEARPVSREEVPVARV